jgi:hypothetical protein
MRAVFFEDSERQDASAVSLQDGLLKVSGG